MDLNFSKILLLLYIKDQNIFNEYNGLPEASTILEILLNDVDLDRRKILNTALTLKALRYKMPESIWKEFEGVNVITENNIVKQFNISEAILSNNRAEAIFEILDILYNKDSHKKANYYGIYESINALYDLGLENYARNYGFEKNLGLIN